METDTLPPRSGTMPERDDHTDDAGAYHRAPDRIAPIRRPTTTYRPPPRLTDAEKARNLAGVAAARAALAAARTRPPPATNPEELDPA